MNDNEYMEMLELYTGIVDILFYRDSISDDRLCVFTKGDALANFRSSTFQNVLRQQGRADEYRQVMRVFRDCGWIACQHEKLTNVQWINGRSIRVISVDYPRYKLIKELLTENRYKETLDTFIKVVEKLIFLDSNENKRICIYSKNGKLLKIKIYNFKFLLEKECGEDLQSYMRLFRGLGWIICDKNKFSKVQKIDNKAMRIVVVDYGKYKLMMELLKG